MYLPSFNSIFEELSLQSHIACMILISSSGNEDAFPVADLLSGNPVSDTVYPAMSTIASIVQGLSSDG